MLMGSRYLLFAVLGSSLPMSAAADICKYLDAEGRTVYSTTPIKNAKRVACFKSAAPPPAPVDSDESVVRREQRLERSVDSMPSTKVDSATQVRRDNDRRGILKDELAQEGKLLSEAQVRLEEQEAMRHGEERNYQKVLDRLKPYQDQVNRHQRNIDSIQKELDNLR